MQKVKMLAEKYALLDSLLFKLVTTPKKEKALLAMPETCANKLITLYYSSMLQDSGVLLKMYLTIGDTFFISGLIHYIISYIKGCHICQTVRK